MIWTRYSLPHHLLEPWQLDHRLLPHPRSRSTSSSIPGWKTTCMYADIILPANTTLEVEDIVTNTRRVRVPDACWIQEQAIRPIGESKSDYEVVVEVAKKLGYEDQFTEGKTCAELEKEVSTPWNGKQL